MNDVVNIGDRLVLHYTAANLKRMINMCMRFPGLVFPTFNLITIVEIAPLITQLREHIYLDSAVI